MELGNISFPSKLAEGNCRMADSESDSKELLAAVTRLTLAIEKQVAMQRDWKLSLRNGLLAGLGGVIGATVIVSILISITQPFKRLERVGPLIERLDDTLSRTNKR